MRARLRSVVGALAEDLASTQTDSDARLRAGAGAFASARLDRAVAPIRAGATLGAAAVDLSALLRYGQPYAALAEGRRRQHAAWLARGRLPLIADFVRMVRALVVLHVYEEIHGPAADRDHG